MGLLDTYLSDRERSLLQKRRSKIGGAFFLLFAIVIVLSYIINDQLSEENTVLMTQDDIKKLKIYLGIFSSFILGYLGWILFRLIKPTYITYLDLITDLLAIKNNIHNTDRPLSSRENTLLRFRELNFAVNNAVLYATITDENRIAYISKKFEEYLGHKEDLTFRKFEEVLTYKHNQHHRIRKILNSAKGELVNKELRLTNHQGEVIWMEMSIINMDNIRNSKRRLIVCHDITQRKVAGLEIQKANRNKFVAEVQSQKDLSQQIMTAQEDERKRIAKDIHDGIGQMLTALRFNIDSIDLSDQQRAEQSLDALKEVFGQLIKDVRTVTFNLAPPELSDHGVTSAIKKLALMVGNFTGQNVIFDNTTGFDKRLKKNVEVNIYRIVQEALNNALKYANSDHILIAISHTESYLKIKIEDHGTGFDPNASSDSFKGTGNGLRFMKERMGFIGGKLRISSEKNKGTTIHIAVPLNSPEDTKKN
ncbi:PAS domain-containing sensor histidine kinase [Ochrovirga pacifica]|uniref:PAS domain-containing sensor histidine kinase n=1 Tax=Ochrovirga pacifica TaxID=1042376 RepID=UPI00025594D6|nr:PAS domain-containing sensor histidine kinase [Ochrovirga pacifica]